METEKPSPRGQEWFCTNGLPSDAVVEVNNMTFHLHKFPLIARSSKLNQLIAEQESEPALRRNGNDSSEIREEEGEGTGEGEVALAPCHLRIEGFPGGSDTFEAAVKFCYGVKVELTSVTVVPLRCAGEFLGMTEEYSEDNLISKTEKYFSQVTLRSLRDSLRALKSCDRDQEIVERLEIQERCIKAIVMNAQSTDLALFGWPMADGGHGRPAQAENRWKGRLDRESWLEDLSILSLPMFKRLILTMIESNLGVDLIETCLMHYAQKCIPGITRSTRKATDFTLMTEIEQLELLEMVISNLNPSRSAIPSRFLFGLLRTGNILKISHDFRVMLEKKISFQLEEVMLDDLLIPSYSYLNDTLYDVDCIGRILGCFLERYKGNYIAMDETGRSTSLIMVGKLVDGYLSEIASDSNLKLGKFYELAVSLPEKARLFDDGLYRAVDMYLKAHPWVSEVDREKICGILDCQKLTLEACTHAAQNERLPLRVVVQVLFFEQLQLRHAIARTLLAADSGVASQGPSRPSGSRLGGDEEAEEGEDQVTAIVGIVPDASTAVGQGSENTTWQTAVRENQVLELDMDSMRTRVHQLERECSTMKKVIEKIDKEGPEGSGGRGTLWRKFGCKFSTQVCNSQDRAVMEGSRGKQRHQHRRQN